MSTAVADLGTAAQKVDPIDRAAASLRAASMGGFATLVELLLKKHKQSFPAEFEDRILNGQDKDGAGPLFHAAFVGHADVIEVLLAQQGIKVNLKNAKDWTPLRAALGNDNADAAELLVEDANVIATKAFHVNWNPLCHASGAGYIHVVKLLLAKDGVKDEIDLQDGDGMTALYLASNNGHTRVVKSLLEAGAKLNQESKGYLMPLYGAASAGHARIVEILLGKGADASPRTHEGDSALDASVTGGHAAVAELLMDHLTKTD
ncbi:putative ankyrin repeat domain-containing protein [Cercophora samala]|uniref:Ankyrin repeat domain-containing protein n=1 Tax=Cercophora samala TaxID=330535 RepID=A0AA40D8R5_9PEZI|nr:putative ankyrin repeat domain-containing protein [Cercophora samala]